MTPVPLELPVRPQEAAELARLVFQLAEGKRLTDELRTRIAARAARLRLETIRPYFGSLAREPVHHSTYYLAVDGGGTEKPVPLLLHMSPPTAPTSAVFRNALLIGRLSEAVINALPFGPQDEENIAAFVNRVDPAFVPRPQGGRPALGVSSNTAAAFEVFRLMSRRTGKNLAATWGVDLATAQWSAIRSGWREGYSAGIELTGAAGETTRRNAGFSHFSVDAPPESAGHIHELIRQARSAANLPRPFDFELSFASAAAATTPEELHAALEFLKAAGRSPQWVAPKFEGLEQIDGLAAVARRFQCGLSIRGVAGYDGAALDTIARATAGRIYYKVCADTDDNAARLEFLGAHLA